MKLRRSKRLAAAADSLCLARPQMQPKCIANGVDYEISSRAAAAAAAATTTTTVAYGKDDREASDFVQWPMKRRLRQTTTYQPRPTNRRIVRSTPTDRSTTIRPKLFNSSGSGGMTMSSRSAGAGGGQMLLGPNNNLSPYSSNNLNNEMDLIKSLSRTHSWHWNEADMSHECVVSDDKLEVCFHPQCSESAAAIRGSEPLLRNGNYYYWELTAFDKTYGTSVMFGICTKQQSLHANDYCNLIGLDENGWSLSHKGFTWHNGSHKEPFKYTDPFPANQTVTIGILFNTMSGTLSYFMNGKNLGVAFENLNDVNSELYPVIGSTAKCTRIRITGAYCGYVSLMERSCFTLIKNAKNKEELVKNLHQQRVPRNIIGYLEEATKVCGSQTEITAQFNDQYNWNVNQATR